MFGSEQPALSPWLPFRLCLPLLLLGISWEAPAAIGYFGVSDGSDHEAI